TGIRAHSVVVGVASSLYDKGATRLNGSVDGTDDGYLLVMGRFRPIVFLLLPAQAYAASAIRLCVLRSCFSIHRLQKVAALIDNCSGMDGKRATGSNLAVAVRSAGGVDRHIPAS